MSLYDDLDIKEESGNEKITKQSVVPGWSPGYKLLASTLQAKKASILQPKKQRTSHLAPVVDLKRHVDTNSPMQFNMQTGKLERVTISSQPQATIAVAPITPQSLLSSSSSLPLSPFHGGGGLGGVADPIPLVSGVADEYDPLRPNEYEEVVKRKKEEKQKERETERRSRGDDRREDNRREDRRERDGRDDRGDRERDRDRDRDRDFKDRDRDRDRDRRRHERRNDDGESEMERMRKRRAEDDEEEEIDRSVNRGGGAAIAPPSSLLEEPPINPDDRPKSPQNMGMAMMGSVASKIMAKYGYKSGQGLGKSEQGMSTALYVEKTSKRGGKIIHEKDMPKESPSSNTNLMKNPSKVILLQNMVGPGEVDEDLEPETAEECTKYGKVNRCSIFEMPDLPEEESVRIFIEFERMESAIKAVVDLNGRFFGGRVVRANFYNLDKFRRMDFSSSVD